MTHLIKSLTHVCLDYGSDQRVLMDLDVLENIPIEQVCENLRCKEDEGLTYTDVEERLSIYGHNKLEEKTESKFFNFLRYSCNPLTDYGSCCYHGNGNCEEGLQIGTFFWYPYISNCK